MLKEEFEKIAGYEVSPEDYKNIIEPMYLATNLSKADFVACIDKKRFALRPLKSLVKDMKKCAASLKETCTHYRDFETIEKLEKIAAEYTKRKYIGIAVYSIRDKMLWSCYYPVEIEIYNPKTFKTYETITINK